MTSDYSPKPQPQPTPQTFTFEFTRGEAQQLLIYEKDSVVINEVIARLRALKDAGLL